MDPGRDRIQPVPRGPRAVFVGWRPGSARGKGIIMGLGLSAITLGRYVVIAASGELDGAAAPALAVIPKTVCNPDKGISLRPSPGVPPRMRAVVLGGCLGVFAAFSILGFFSSLVPTFFHGILGVGNLARAPLKPMPQSSSRGDGPAWSRSAATSGHFSLAHGRAAVGREESDASALGEARASRDSSGVFR